MAGMKVGQLFSSESTSTNYGRGWNASSLSTDYNKDCIGVIRPRQSSDEVDGDVVSGGLIYGQGAQDSKWGTARCVGSLAGMATAQA